MDKDSQTIDVEIIDTDEHVEKLFKLADYLTVSKDNTNRFCKTAAELCKRIDFVPKHIVQVGAANDTKVLEFQEFIDLGAKVLLFEPHPEFYKILVQDFGHMENVSIFELGIYNKVGKFKMWDKWASSCLEECIDVPKLFTDKEKEDIRRENKFFYINCALFSGFDNGTIDLLYLDSNSCEMYCLEHMKSLPAMIVIETHYIFGGYRNPNYDKIHAWMTLHDYKLAGINESDKIFLRYLEKI